MSEWQQQLENYYSLVEELLEKREKAQGELRFSRYFIVASDIAEQYFCEKKVEMQYLRGEIETEEKTMGTEAHEKLLQDSVRIKRKELWQKVYGKKPVVALEMLLLAKHKGIILAGRPDSIVFQNGCPLVVFEYKFTKSAIAHLTYHVQARAYGLLLRNMGFDTSRLFYAIVLADPKARHDNELKRKVVNAVAENGPKESVLNIENAAIYVCKFNDTDAEKDLDWAIEFWKNTREAITTKNPNKCKKCEYRVECERSIHKELSSF
jgi:CRISPR/Cas system-associated exonuclease Cas4 (RecB family)